MTRTRAIAYFLDSLADGRGDRASCHDRGERGDSSKPLPAAAHQGKQRDQATGSAGISAASLAASGGVRWPHRISDQMRSWK